VTLGVCSHEAVALTVLATIVSMNADFFIIDAGSKVLSSDLGPHGTDRLEGYGLAFPVEEFDEQRNGMIVTRLSEEHGFLPRGTARLAIGSRVRIVPNHACVVANLADRFMLLDDGKPPKHWPVSAR